MGQIDLGWGGGKRRRKTLYGKSRREVAELLGRAGQAAKNGSLIADERQTLAQFLASWLRDVARPRVRARTFDTYEAAVSRHLVPHLGPLKIARLTPQDLERWLSALKTRGVSNGRRAYARVVLRTALETAVRWGLVSRNVAKLVDAARTTPKQIVPLTPEQAQHLLKTVEGGPLYGFVAVALGCGLRLGEALGLKWEHVDLDAGTLSVRQALQRFGGDVTERRPLLEERRRLLRVFRAAPPAARLDLQGNLDAVRARLKTLRTSVHIVEPKSPRSLRTIALPGVTIAALKAHRLHQRKMRLAAGPAWEEAGFVFSTPLGTPADPHNIHKQFREVLAAAKLPQIRIHDLRHSCATLLLAQGVDPRTIMQTLGHSQVSLTLNTYAHVLPSLQREAAAKMDVALGRK